MLFYVFELCAYRWTIFEFFFVVKLCMWIKLCFVRASPSVSLALSLSHYSFLLRSLCLSRRAICKITLWNDIECRDKIQLHEIDWTERAPHKARETKVQREREIDRDELPIIVFEWQCIFGMSIHVCVSVSVYVFISSF